MKRALCVLLLVGAACTIVIVRPKSPSEMSTLPQLPIDLKLPKPDFGPQGPNCPIEASPSRPTADVIALVREDRAMVTLGPSVEGWLITLLGAMQARNVTLSHLLVASYENQDGHVWPFAFNSCAIPDPEPLRAFFSYYADRLAAPATCPIDRLLELGVATQTLYASIPGALLTGSEPPFDAPFFSSPPTYVLVVLIDHAARPACADDNAMFWPAAPASWLTYPNGPVPPSEIFFVTIATSEQEDAATMDKRCAGIDGFPQPFLDLMEPAPNGAFDPFTAAINARSGDTSVTNGHALHVDICDALSLNGPELLTDVVRKVHTHLGLPLEPMQ